MKLDCTKYESETDVSGSSRLEPGMYHVVVADVDESMDKFDAIAATLHVLADADGDATGELRHMMFLKDGKATRAHERFALATGILKPGSKANVQFSDAIGSQLVVNIEHSENKKSGKVFAGVGNWGCDVWSVKNPEVADVPKNKSALKALAEGRSIVSSGREEAADDDGFDDLDF